MRSKWFFAGHLSGLLSFSFRWPIRSSHTAQIAALLLPLCFQLPAWTVAAADDTAVFPRAEAGTKTNAEAAVKTACAKLGGTWTGHECRPGRTVAPSTKNACAEAGGTFDSASGKCSAHPWYDGNPDSEIDWRMDTINMMADVGKFFDCLEPQMILPICPYCVPQMIPDAYLDSDCSKPYVNPGMIFEYWWPEMEIEINNFGISSFNPVSRGKIEYAREALEQGIENIFKNENLVPYLERIGTDPSDPAAFSKALADLFKSSSWKELRKAPQLGQTHFSGMLPGDQSVYSEAHMYLTELQDRLSQTSNRKEGHGYYDLIWFEYEGICFPGDLMLFNGYRKGNPDKCFYDTLDPKADIVKAWTEESKYAEYWRIPESSAEINEKFYKVSVPFDTREIHGLSDFRDAILKHNSYGVERSCDSYRIGEWIDRYGELKNIGIQSLASSVDSDTKDALSRLCYYGGAELYPLVGSLLGVYTDAIASPYLSRRGLEVGGQVSHNHLKNRPASGTKQTEDKFRNHCGGKDHINRFTRFHKLESGKRNRETDKLQRIYPDITACFRMNEVDERDHELFPPDLLKPEHNGSIRYVYWNRRQACACDLRGSVSHPERDNGNFAIDGLPYGWGCMTYPYDNYDVGRGNIEQYNPAGIGIPAIVPLCTFPYLGTRSLCKENAGTMEIDASQGSERPCQKNQAASSYLGGIPVGVEGNDYKFDYEWEKTWENDPDYLPPSATRRD